MTDLTHFHYVYDDRKQEKTLFTLHGTGADEHDLMPLTEGLPYNVVGLRGNVSEQGMLRFFMRFPDGSFDMESIEAETHKLNQFVKTWSETYQVPVEKMAFLGYSNGANMILATLFRYPEFISKAVLLHSMLPFHPKPMNFTGKQFLVTQGRQDQMIAFMEGQAVIKTLKDYGADVEAVVHEGGHEIRPEEMDAMRAFFRLAVEEGEEEEEIEIVDEAGFIKIN
jgi:phospholipase/carboxylesterase